MSRIDYETVSLEEYRPRLLPDTKLPQASGELLWRQYSTQIAVEFPSPVTGYQWRLTAQGWVGYIPLTPELGLSLLPKVPIQSLFGMLEYAYGQQTFRTLSGLYEAQSLTELYERLAELLARRVLRRCRDGLARAYIAQTEERSVIRGNVNVRRMAQRPWDTRVECTYHEHTADIDDNQILAWTLFIIERSGICSPERALPIVHQAFRQLQGTVSLVPVTAAACIRRQYHRLNSDYAALHALCRFFLENSGPHYAVGNKTMVPFLIDMARLYEEFVAGWMQAHLPPTIRIEQQVPYRIDTASGLEFRIDVVLFDEATGETRCVLDTKYKRVSMPSTSDVAQIVAYAQAKGCHDAILAYPYPLTRPLDAWIGDIRVRSVVFSLHKGLESGGQEFLQQVLQSEFSQ